jgi:uncharacterized SAM-binding protein YcdF (DUF218 family)
VAQPISHYRRALLLVSVATLGMVAGALLLASILAGDIYDYQDTVDGVHLPPVDAIVVLAGGKGRISTAGDLWYRYWEQAHRPPVRGEAPPPKVPTFYVSGMGHQANWNVFARQIRRGVLEVIHPDDVILERESANTEENAEWLIKNVRLQQWKRIMLVTSSYHMKRSRQVLEKMLRATNTPLEIETLSIFQDPFEAAEWRSSLSGYRITMFEYLKGIYYKYFWAP